MPPEILKRSVEFKTAYNSWKTNGNGASILALLKSFYEATFTHGDARCDIIRRPEYNMLVLHYTDDFVPDDFTFLMDHVQDVLLANGYYNYMSDLRRQALDGGMKQVTERHYLKPNIAFGPQASTDRRFGNVIIEVVYEDDAPVYLKLTCNYYSERHLPMAKGIDKLMEEILKL